MQRSIYVLAIGRQSRLPFSVLEARDRGETMFHMRMYWRQISVILAKKRPEKFRSASMHRLMRAAYFSDLFYSTYREDGNLWNISLLQFLGSQFVAHLSECERLSLHCTVQYVSYIRTCAVADKHYVHTPR